MNTGSEEKGHWEVGAEGLKLNNDTIAELRKYESQYRKIVNQGMDLTNQRGFQIGLFILMTVCVLGIGYISPYAPYSYLLSFIVIAIQWYIFSLYEKRRKTMDSPAPGDGALVYFTHKRDLLLEVVYLKKIAIVNSVLMFLNIWATKPLDRLFEPRSFILLGFVGFIIIAAIILHKIKVTPVIAYLNGLVQHLETENVEFQKGS